MKKKTSLDYDAEICQSLDTAMLCIQHVIIESPLLSDRQKCEYSKKLFKNYSEIIDLIADARG